MTLGNNGLETEVETLNRDASACMAMPPAPSSKLHVRLLPERPAIGGFIQHDPGFFHSQKARPIWKRAADTVPGRNNPDACSAEQLGDRITENQ